MRGCIAKNDEGQYFLVSQRGSKIQLSSNEDLAPHVGKQVRASGSFIAPQGSSSSASAPKEDGATRNLHHEHEFRIMKIDVLSQSCPAGKKR